MITPPSRPPVYNPVQLDGQIQQNIAASRATVPVSVTAVTQAEKAEPPEPHDGSSKSQDQEKSTRQPSGSPRGRVLDIKA